VIFTTFGGQEVKDPTRIDLTRAEPLRCGFPVSGRCLLAADPPDLWSIASEGLDGSVVVAGRVTQGGTFIDVRVVESRAASDKTALTNAALGSLRTWRFEPAAHQDAVVVTMRFAEAPSPTGRNIDALFARFPDGQVVEMSSASKLTITRFRLR